MKMSNEVNEVMKSFMEFQQEVVNPVKDTKGYGYKYAKLDSVVDVVKEAMSGKGLSFNQEVGYDERGNILVTTNIFHESGQWLSFGPVGLPKDTGKSMSDVQGAGSSITYARRYSLAAATGLASEEDVDGSNSRGSRKSINNNSSRSSKKTETATQKQIATINEWLESDNADKVKVMLKQEGYRGMKHIASTSKSKVEELIKKINKEVG
jgi:hypothetical protein